MDDVPRRPFCRKSFCSSGRNLASGNALFDPIAFNSCPIESLFRVGTRGDGSLRRSPLTGRSARKFCVNLK
jgi:hypothetical protein